MEIFLYDETSGWNSFLKENVGEVKCEADPDVALSRILLEEFDIAFINLYGSEQSSLTGLDLLKKVRAKDNFTPIVVFTTDESNRYIREAYDAGCDWYFIKGMDSPSEFSYLLERYAAPEIVRPRGRMRSIFNALMSGEPIPVLQFRGNQTVRYREKGDVLTLSEMTEVDRKMMAMGLSNLVKKNLADRSVRESLADFILSFFIKGGVSALPSLKDFVDNSEGLFTDDFFHSGLKLEIIELFYQTDVERRLDYAGVSRFIKNCTRSIERYVPVDVLVDKNKPQIEREGVEYISVIVENSLEIQGVVPVSQFSHLENIPSRFKAVRKKFFHSENRPELLLVFDYYEVVK